MQTIRKSWSKLTAAILVTTTLVAILLPNAGIGQVLNNYLIHIMLLMLLSGLAGLFVNKRDILFTGLACTAVLALYLKNASNLSLKYPKANQEIHFSVAHINLSNALSFQDIRQVLAVDTPDIISLQEFTPEWTEVVEALTSAGYPFSFRYPSADPYGKAVFSRHPLKDQSFIYLGDVPNAYVAVDKGGIEFKVYSVYLTPALNKFTQQQSSKELGKLSEILSGKAGHVFVLGEFNQVYWSADIIRFRKETGLHNSRRDIIPNKSGAPYDHIFYSPEMECFSFSEIADEEGNHLGCKGKFQMKSKKHKL